MATEIEDRSKQRGRQWWYKSYNGPAGGWGSVTPLGQDPDPGRGARSSGSATLMRQNKPDGFACVSCAWAKPAEPHPFEFCENGAKATAWEITSQPLHARVLRASTP